jgi:hypothetical protein
LRKLVAGDAKQKRRGSTETGAPVLDPTCERVGPEIPVKTDPEESLECCRANVLKISLGTIQGREIYAGATRPSW